MDVSDGGSAWGDAFDFPLPGRSAKPRTTGLTMVIDKGLGLTETHDMLDLAHGYIDYLKLTFGTSAFYTSRLLREKIALVRSRGVRIFPGGTFLEIARLRTPASGRGACPSGAAHGGALTASALKG